MKYLISLIVGLFRGWYAEFSRDKAHEDLGEANANLEHEQNANKKIEEADGAQPDLSPDGLSDDPNSTSYD